MTDAHKAPRTLHEVIAYPDHEIRTTSAEFRRSRHHLIDELYEPCWVCGIRKSTGGAMELHHTLEWSLANALDPVKVFEDWAWMGAADNPHLRAALDAEGGLTVLCATHHRHGLYGIHMVTYPAWVAQRYLRDGYDLATGPTKETTDDAGL